jgi:hypothetical protein
MTQTTAKSDTQFAILSQRDLVAYFIATGGWDDRKKRFDDIQGDDYAKADAIINHLIEVVGKMRG